MFKRKPRNITEICTVRLNGEAVEIKVSLSRRRSTAIIVRPNMCVEVKAPVRSSIPKLMLHVESKALWIIKQREKFRGRAGSAKPKQYIEGECFSFIGQDYKLKFVGSKLSKVVLNGEFMEIHGRAKTPAAIKAQLKLWYNEKAREVFEERMPDCLKAVENLKLPKYKLINVKKMKGRWGSCASDKTITLNTELVAAPVNCIDYVIIHELCHLREHNHSPRYYKLLSAAMPDWKANKELLNRAVQSNFL